MDLDGRKNDAYSLHSEILVLILMSATCSKKVGQEHVHCCVTLPSLFTTLII